MAAASIAAACGVETAATTRRPHKAGALGADHVVVDDGGPPAPRVRALWPDGPDYVLDLVGAGTAVDSLRLVRRGGTVSVFHSDAARGRAEVLQRVVDRVEAGVYRANLDRVFGLGDIVAAHRYLEADRATGKVVVLP
jgi:NADPH:quinone reductase-like Zn-dependent oxidoreductase